MEEPQSQTTPSATSQPTVELGKADRFKRSFFQILIGCLIGAAIIAITAVLIGSFSDILARALGTIAVVALHAMLSFSYISETEKRNKKDGGRSIDLFSNFVFVLIIFSFITSLFALWQLLGGEVALRLFGVYGVLLFATMHADVMYRIRRFDSKLDGVVTANYVSMAVVVIMLTFVIFSNELADLGDAFYRILAAVGIIDATLSITAIIMHKLYLQKHPDAAAMYGSENTVRSKGFLSNPFVVLILIYLVLQVVAALIGVVMTARN